MTTSTCPACDREFACRPPAPTCLHPFYAAQRMTQETPLRTQRGWWVISGEALAEALRRAHAGENPDALYIEYYANTEVEHVDGE